MPPYSVVGIYICFLVFSVDSNESVIDSITPELFILDTAGNQQQVDNVALQFNSHVTLLCRTSARDTELFWQFAVVDTNRFLPVTESGHITIERTKNGSTALKLTRIQFSQAGTYQCSNAISTAQVNIHVYGILNAISTTVNVFPRKEMVGNIQFHTMVFDQSTKPTVACQFRVGRSGIKYTSVRWKGGLFATNPSLYELSQTANEEDGFIWSNLSIAHPSFDPALYGKYQCLFNIVPGSMETEEVEIAVPPVIKRPDNLEGYHSGKRLSHRCEIVAYPPVDGPVTWSRNEKPITIDGDGRGHVAEIDWADRVHFETEVYPNDRIVFDPVLPEDRAVYSCFVQSPLGNATGAFYMRVKDRWTVLWPLIGIIIELVILIVIIVIYELRRRKQAKQQAADSPDRLGTNSGAGYGHTGSSDDMALRHRPVRS